MKASPATAMELALASRSSAKPREHRGATTTYEDSPPQDIEQLYASPSMGAAAAFSINTSLKPSVFPSTRQSLSILGGGGAAGGGSGSGLPLIDD